MQRSSDDSLKSARYTLTAGLLICLLASPGYAYVDPNTGGYLFQLLTPLYAIVIAAGFFFANQVKAIWDACGIALRKIASSIK
jgi:hypothetical protein